MTQLLVKRISQGDGMRTVKVVMLNIELFELMHGNSIMMKEEMEATPVSSGLPHNMHARIPIHKVEIKQFDYKGVEYNIALNKDAQELVTMFSAVEFAKYKDIMLKEHERHADEIDKLHHKLKLANDNWWNKFKSWLS